MPVLLLPLALTSGDNVASNAVSNTFDLRTPERCIAIWGKRSIWLCTRHEAPSFLHQLV